MVLAFSVCLISRVGLLRFFAGFETMRKIFSMFTTRQKIITMGKFVIKTGTNGQYYLSLKADNGEKGFIPGF